MKKYRYKERPKCRTKISELLNSNQKYTLEEIASGFCNRFHTPKRFTDELRKQAKKMLQEQDEDEV